jgi:hypothetical protein
VKIPEEAYVAVANLTRLRVAVHAIGAMVPDRNIGVSRIEIKKIDEAIWELILRYEAKIK